MQIPPQCLVPGLRMCWWTFLTPRGSSQLLLSHWRCVQGGKQGGRGRPETFTRRPEASQKQKPYLPDDTALEAEFERNKYLSVAKRLQLSRALRLTETQNRRTKWKRRYTGELELAAQRYCAAVGAAAARPIFVGDRLWFFHYPAGALHPTGMPLGAPALGPMMPPPAPPPPTLLGLPPPPPPHGSVPTPHPFLMSAASYPGAGAEVALPPSTRP
ncbi:Homeobox protein B-H1 [Gryllus bimaculatus]|nr:Homeobox protein B-H1 [Gryllus bimaculatus]